MYTKLHAILSNSVSNIMYNLETYYPTYCVQYWPIYCTILNIKLYIILHEYNSILYNKLFTILQSYCSIYLNILHIAHIARVLINCTYCQFCTKLYNIVLQMPILFGPCTSSYKFYILSKLLKIVPNCLIYASIVRSLLSEMQPATLLLQCLLLQCLLLLCCQYHWLSYYAMNSQQPFIYWATPSRGASNGSTSRSTLTPQACSLALGSSSGEPPPEAGVCCSTTLYQQTTATRPTLPAYREPGIPNLQRLE